MFAQEIVAGTIWSGRWDVMCLKRPGQATVTSQKNDAVIVLEKYMDELVVHPIMSY